MSLLDSLKGLFSGSSADAGPTADLHIIDTERFSGRNGGRDRVSPREQVAMLQQLAAFAEKEKIRLCAILEGRPLREAPDRGEFKGVQVFYAERSEDVSRIALDLVGRNRNALLITQNRDLERQAQAAGAQTLRSGTLRKALEDNGGRSDDGRSGGRGGRRRGRGRRGGGRGQPQNQKPPQQKQQNEKPAKEARDGVSDLIDLV